MLKIVFGTDRAVSCGGGASMTRAKYYKIVPGDYELVNSHEIQDPDNDGSGYDVVQESFVVIDEYDEFPSRPAAAAALRDYDPMAAAEINRHWTDFCRGERSRVML